MVAVLEDAARAAAEADEAPQRLPGLDPSILAQLRHLDGCPEQRIEQVTGGAACLDCGARRVEKPPPEPLPGVESPAYRRLWKLNPTLITEQLSDEQLGDPKQNPKHPGAADEPPAWQGGRPTR